MTVIIAGSPRKGMYSDRLAEAYKEKKENSIIFYARTLKGAPCKGCGYCKSKGNGICVQKDDMEKLRNLILSSDMMVLATPLYYFGFSSQLKLVIDRWYSFTTALSAKHMKTALIVAAWDSNDWTMEDIAHHYRTLCRYMNFQDMGMILGKGCGSVSMTKNSGFPEKAYELGRSL